MVGKCAIAVYITLRTRQSIEVNIETTEYHYRGYYTKSPPPGAFWSPKTAGEGRGGPSLIWVHSKIISEKRGGLNRISEVLSFPVFFSREGTNCSFIISGGEDGVI